MDLATAALIRLRPATDRLAGLEVDLGAIDYAHDGGGLYEFHAFHGDPFTYAPFAALARYRVFGVDGERTPFR